MIPVEKAHMLVAAGTDPGMKGKNNEDQFSVTAYQTSSTDPIMIGQIQVLDLHRRFLIAEPLGEVVIEILVARAHTTDVKSHVAADGHHALFHIVTHDDGHEGRDVELAQILAAAGFGKPLLDRLFENMVGEDKSLRVIEHSYVKNKKLEEHIIF